MYRITAIICSAFISAVSILGSAFVPSLPYLPPTDVHILGWINNIYGVTAISEGTETEKLEAYWNMYRAIMGSAFDNFKADMQEVLDNTKTGRKIYISPSLNQTIVEALKNAKNNGVVIGETQPPATTPQQWVDELYAHGIHMTLAMATELKSKIDSYGYVGNGQPYTLGVGVDGRDNGTIRFWPYYVGVNTYFAPHPTLQGFQRFLHDDNNPEFYQYIYYLDLQDMEVWRFKSQAFTGTSFSPYNGLYFKMSGTETKTNISAMSTSASESIEDETQIPITANTVVENGVLDETKPVIVNLPSVNPYPAIDPQQIAEVLRELGVVPASETEDVSQTVQQLKEEASTKYGDAGDYALDLTRYFPFCLPFDVARILQALVAEPEAPSFSYTINNPFSEDPGDDIVLEIDLAQFNDVAAILRTLESIAFVVGLAVVTRSLYLRG